MWLPELREGNEKRFLEQFRMINCAFQQLELELTQNYGLMRTKNVSTNESIDIFVYMIGHGVTYENAKSDFNILVDHSLAISLSFNSCIYNRKSIC